MSKIHIPFFTIVATYFSYFIVITLGHARDFVGRRLFPSMYRHFFPNRGRPPLFTTSASFYTRRLYGRIKDAWNRPITGTPGRVVSVLIQTRTKDGEFVLTGEKRPCLNLGSYNYLGNAGKHNQEVKSALDTHPLLYCAPSSFIPACPLIQKLEKEIAVFLEKEDAVVFPMGFATNSCTIPYLVDRGDLIVTDSLNHSSIFFGTRVSPCKVEIFEHNNIDALQKIIQRAVVRGQDGTYKAYGRILVIVEGLYSMEGECVPLRKLVALKKKYKFYLFVDEAHSIGAMGRTGRGVCEYLGVDFSEVDVLMGTFTKSFGAAGGYIASTKKVISLIRKKSELVKRGDQLSPLVVTQILASLREMRTPEGVQMVQSLAEKSKYFRQELEQMGFVLLGEADSPVVPLMIFNPGKIAEFSRMCLKENIAVVVVGYPATSVVTSRVRFCLSAAHTEEDLRHALSVISKVGDILGLKMKKKKKNAVM